MSPAKLFARKVVFPLFTGLHLEKLLSAFAQHGYLVLMYHGVVKNQQLKLSVNHLSVVDFDTHISYLKNNFDIVSLKEIFERSRSKIKSKRKTIAITFDDGYENNYTNAFPVLKKYNVPATIFVVAKGIVDASTILWYDYLDGLKEQIDYSLFPTLNIALGDSLLKARSITNISQFRGLLKSLNPREKDLLFENILPQTKFAHITDTLDPEYRKLLSRNQMREMINSGLIEIGSHSLNHPNLDVLGDEELRLELRESKKILEQHLGSPIVSLAFPDGAYNQKVKMIALEEGYKNLLSVEPKLASDREDANLLPRFCISNTTTPASNFIQIHQAFSTIGF
jgi:peptidoglycan/xylan/chitin deacetylase (PgdA/CDA1 family)